ncbi:MAG: restriction endonuclease [Chloroflexaceae bacterium]|nr:restriction endonuclease [Chloroflexaceae bacterium]
MDFLNQVRDIATRIPRQVEYIQTEEATKTAFILPFIAALGYNVFDPTEVTPEYTADVGTKKGEKVDYAILKDGEPIILFECKHHSVHLGEVQASQLHRYFHVTKARFAILTNGIVYRLYTDLVAPNLMDDKPFFEFNMLDYTERDVDELKKFCKSVFDVGNILTTASELKYTFEIKRIVGVEMQTPSDEFVKHFASQVYAGRMSQSAMEQFRPIVLKAFRQYINDQISSRLKSALGSSDEPAPTLPDDTTEPAAETQEPEEEKPKIVTTQEEMDGYYIVRAILRENIDVKRIAMRDAQSYCSILLDENNRKPLCRLWFNRSQKYLGLFDGDKEDKVPIDDVDSIYQYADRLKATIQKYT